MILICAPKAHFQLHVVMWSCVKRKKSYCDDIDLCSQSTLPASCGDVVMRKKKRNHIVMIMICASKAHFRLHVVMWSCVKKRRNHIVMIMIYASKAHFQLHVVMWSCIKKKKSYCDDNDLCFQSTLPASCGDVVLRKIKKRNIVMILICASKAHFQLHEVMCHA